MLLVIQIALGIVLGFAILAYWRQIIAFGIVGLLSVLLLGGVIFVCVYLYRHTPSYDSIMSGASSTIKYLLMASYIFAAFYAVWCGLKAIANTKWVNLKAITNPIQKLQSVLSEYKFSSSGNTNKYFIFILILCFVYFLFFR